MTKTEQLQIRVSPEQKATLQTLAAAAGRDVSSYVLDRLLPSLAGEFGELLQALDGSNRRYALAELNDLLTNCPPILFRDVVADGSPLPDDPYMQNYVAALVEQAAGLKGVAPPDWVQLVGPLSEPHFATPMRSLRMFLIRSAPVPFKRRNIFVDSGIGARV